MSKPVERANFLEKAVNAIGKKYDLLILDSFLQNKGRRRFNQLLAAVPNINPRILSMRLKDLEKNGLVSKTLVLGTPVKTEYQLNEKGESLHPLIEGLKAWAQK
ncbi:MAG: helix-turn-helix transcriptional regulator [Candidatus Diapherotrites archaeon]|uniref:Helix-turn-helix transcriptional regulator n=1 Tax=Candidatus Iainarchaeum sp. TaxID=3101447 RepID=A0A7J4JU92_9ARCH|nr:helix-turn-helix transcriptional regulator [Candidatus Diapherotrites archaeon]HIH21353.1 helix-turn-helix transcriptional regulator [Candidatus Diapherotrites archaeon]HIH33010.1 helix-turn-helix transcriptional regulator [Candidatus Diapherotrites archaeon]